ncbi:glutamic acid-rich protein-like isoform X2 [Leptopilina boulardi]|uniref:glutamic acid-rich protein-like isoform X2 n=1 Tax=Leptopilina boulardi TaxID=63433 RepID=UPI0021F60CDF|nr:glutamic acid-rich protein-like isoform X2 [Leptopilina boulardi]
MVIESMRVGGGRCPPLLVGGLFVVCLMLIVNWYSLSSENLELLRQLDELGEQLKISAEERDECVTSRAKLQQSKKKSEEEKASLHVRIAHQYELQKQKVELEMSLTACKTQVSSLTNVDKTRSATIDALHLEKNTTSIKLKETIEENKKLHDELDKLKNELEAAKLAINAPQENKVMEIVPKAQENTKIKKNIEGGVQNSQDEEDEMKKQINHMISGHNLFEDTDDVELNNVADEEKDQKLVTNDEEKQKNLVT